MSRAAAPAKADNTFSAGKLRLYIARSTPNSTRAERNLMAASSELPAAKQQIDLEAIDIFTHPKRAITDGVIVTPALIILGSSGRTMILGDFADEKRSKLPSQSLQELML